MIDLTIDYHSHILPGCDHGCRDVGMALQQIEMAKKIGIQTICATPHFYPHKESVDNFLKRRTDCSQLLFQSREENSPFIKLGAEVLICDGMEKLDGLSRLCLEGTNELLLEMPFYEWPDHIWDTLYQLIDLQDIQLVIAHADRYPVENIQQLISEGVPLQLNAECLKHPLRRKRYLSWINDGYVQYLGSDIHELGSGYRDFAKCKKIIG